MKNHAIPALLRTLTSVYVAPFYLVFAGIFVLVGNRWNFLGDSYLSLETLTNLSLWLLPILAGLNAFDTSLLSRPGSIEMILTGAKWRRMILAPALLSTIALSATHIILTAALLITGGVTDPVVGWHRIALTLLVQCLVFLGVALLGSAIGRVLSVSIAGFTAFALVFTLQLFTEQVSIGTQWLTLGGGATATQIGYVWNLQNQSQRIAQTILVIAACSFIIGIQHNQSRQSRIFKVAGILSLTLALCLGSVLPSAPHKTYLKPPPQANTCIQFKLEDDSDLLVCVTSESTRMLEYVAERYRDAFAAFEEANVDTSIFPHRYEESVKGTPELEDGVGYLNHGNKKRSYTDLGAMTDEEFLNSFMSSFMVPDECTSGEVALLDSPELLTHLEPAQDFVIGLVFDDYDSTVTAKEFEEAYQSLENSCRAKA